MQRTTLAAWATLSIILLVGPAAVPATAGPPTPGDGPGPAGAIAFDPSDPLQHARHASALVPPGGSVVLDVDVDTMTLHAHGLPAGAPAGTTTPGTDDVACTNPLPESFMWMARSTVAVAPVIQPLGGCQYQLQTESMDHVRVVSAGNFNGGIQAYNEDPDVFGMFTVWCGGPVGVTDRPPEDGDGSFEDPEDLLEPEPTLVHCYAITRGDVHPSDWTRWSVININWHGNGGVVDARISTTG